MKDSIQYVNVDPGDKVSQALTSCFEGGLSAALRPTRRQHYVSCLRMEKTGLAQLLKAHSMATVAVEFAYTGTLSGHVLLLAKTIDLLRLSEMVAGTEAVIGDSMPAEAVDACRQFFARAAEAANAQFAARYGQSLECGMPELIQAHQGAGAQLPLSAGYEDVLCATLQFIVEPQLDTRVQLLLTPEVVRALAVLVPADEAVPDPRRSTAPQASPSPGEPAENTRNAAPESSGARAPRNRVVKNSQSWNIDLLLDVELPIAVSFGEAQMQLRDVLKLGVGSVVELDRSVNDPVTIIVNQKPIARGEVVMVDGNYGVRILEVESTADRIRSLG